MAKRKQARPSRPGVSTAVTNDIVVDGHVDNEGEGELAAVFVDAEGIPSILDGVEQAASGNPRKRRRLKNVRGNLMELGFSCIPRVVYSFERSKPQCIVLSD